MKGVATGILLQLHPNAHGSHNDPRAMSCAASEYHSIALLSGPDGVLGDDFTNLMGSNFSSTTP